MYNDKKLANIFQALKGGKEYRKDEPIELFCLTHLQAGFLYLIFFSYLQAFQYFRLLYGTLSLELSFCLMRPFLLSLDEKWMEIRKTVKIIAFMGQV